MQKSTTPSSRTQPTLCGVITLAALFGFLATAKPSLADSKIILANAYYPEYSGSIFTERGAIQRTRIELMFHALENFDSPNLPPSVIEVFVVSAKPYTDAAGDPQLEVVHCGQQEVLLTEADLMHPDVRLIRKELELDITLDCPNWILGIGYIFDQQDLANLKFMPAFAILPDEEALGSLYSDKDGYILPGLTFEQLADFLPGVTGSTQTNDITDIDPLPEAELAEIAAKFTPEIVRVDAVDLAEMPPPCTSNTSIIIHAKPSQPPP